MRERGRGEQLGGRERGRKEREGEIGRDRVKGREERKKGTSMYKQPSHKGSLM